MDLLILSSGCPDRATRRVRFVKTGGCYDESIEPALCKICGIRKPRRACPGVHGDICAICCGTQREQTVHCPLDCGYLREARRREETPLAQSAEVPNKDIRVSNEFLRTHEDLIVWLIVDLLKAAFQPPRAVDSDVKEALAALVKTYRTLQSGLIYETRPINPAAGGIYAAVTESVDEFRRRAKEASGIPSLRDAEVLGGLVFLERLAVQHDNGRRLGRAFIDFLSRSFPSEVPKTESTSLLV